MAAETEDGHAVLRCPRCGRAEPVLPVLVADTRLHDQRERHESELRAAVRRAESPADPRYTGHRPGLRERIFVTPSWARA